MVVVDIDLVAQIFCLSLLYLDQRVSSHEVCTSVPTRIGEPKSAWIGIGPRLVQTNLAIPVLVLGHGWLRILLVPVNHESPHIWISLHPVAHELESEGDFYYPIGYDLHPLVVALVVIHSLCEEDF